MASADELLDSAPLSRLHKRVWLVAAMGLMLDGFDFFVVGVCLPLIREDFEPTAVEQGLIASAAVIGSVFGALIAGPISDRIGRRLLFRMDLLLFIVAALASSLAWDAWSLIIFRLLLGFAIGADYPLSAAYAAEIAPRRFRNRLLVGVISFQAIGSLLGVGLGLIILQIYPQVDAWRWIFAAGAVLAVVVVLVRIGVPESPRWLLTQGHRGEAAKVVSLFVGQTVRPEQVVVSKPAPAIPWRTLFTAEFRRRTTFTTAPWFLMDVVVYGIGVFTPTIIAGLVVADANSFIGHEISSLIGTAFTDLFLVLGFAAALLLINRLGFVRLQVGGFLGMTVGLGLLAVAAGRPGDFFWLAFVGFALSNFCQNAGPNSTTFLLPAVVFPTHMRATGAGLAAAAGKAGAVLVTLVFPILQDSVGLSATIGIMAVGAFLATIITIAARPN